MAIKLSRHKLQPKDRVKGFVHNLKEEGYKIKEEKKMNISCEV